MTTSSPDIHGKNFPGLVFAFLISGLMFMLIACVSFTVTPILTNAPVTVNSPTATHSLSWSVAKIAKPTYTPSPTPIFTPTPTNAPTVLPPPSDAPSLLSMELVEDSADPTAQAEDSSSNAMDMQQTYSGGKYILVSISEQHLYAYDNDQLIYSFIASTGMGNSTRVGRFSVLDKIPNAYGANWNIWMPDWLGIYWSGNLENGIHALPILPGGDRLWSGYLGTPISFGCVVLGVDEALQLYNWVDIGTPVEIRW